MIILVVSVGGSLQPIVTSIAQSKPDKVYFLCSRGSSGSVEEICTKAKAENITRKVDIIDDIDDLNKCYADSLALLQRLRDEFPEARIIADYTGGTKSMSAGLAAAALDTENVTLGLVSGARFNLTQVTDGTQSLRTSQAIKIRLERRLPTIYKCFANFDYPAAMSWLEETLMLPDISSEKTAMLQSWLALARALDSWDKFDHASAWKTLHNYRAEYTGLVMFLEAVIWSRKKLNQDFERQPLPGITRSPRRGMSEDGKGHGYELVEDLLLNARRRAIQGRFDDAVARLYRALELLAQARLKLKYNINTGDVSTKLLPQPLQEEYQEMASRAGTIKLSLIKDFELLAKLAGLYTEPLGTLYKKYKNRVKDFLSIRNKSLMAHGMTPVNADDFEKANALVASLMDGTFEALHLKLYTPRVQFPAHPQGG